MKPAKFRFKRSVILWRSWEIKKKLKKKCFTMVPNGKTRKMPIQALIYKGIWQNC